MIKKAKMEKFNFPSIIQETDFSPNFLKTDIYARKGDFQEFFELDWEKEGGLPKWAPQNNQKLRSARLILEEIKSTYYHLFQPEGSRLSLDLKEKSVFFNSNLLYLIAATDGNEDTLGHSQLVAQYSLVLARALGIEDQEFLVDLERGALLHDIGKIGIPESILRKPGALTEMERQIVQEHPLLGYELIMDYDFLKKAANVVLYHHERYDGQGYPYGLAGGEIPLEARIFSVADTLDAITSDRPYRSGQSLFVACEEIEKGKGSQFDPEVVEAFFSVKEEVWLEIKYNAYHRNYLTTLH
ncbi:MAG: hypothetical protein DRJ11_01535 [Candidatus Aminicenantes bacterium]|nr:MAG: hypothetical protein DRJ11_01535 [Candidatus Aminicenantes bacterium]